MNKSNILFVVIVVAALSILLVLFLVMERPFIGKAITFIPSTGFIAGAEVPVEVPLKQGELATIRVGAVVPAGQESAVWSFTLNFDTTRFRLIDVDSKLLEDWGMELWKVTKGVNAGIGTVTVEHGTLDPSKVLTGGSGGGGEGGAGTAYRLAEVNLEVLTAITMESELSSLVSTNALTFTDVTLWSLADSPVDFIPDGTALTQPSGVAKCVANDGLCGSFCSAAENRLTYCNYNTQCNILFPCQPQTVTSYNADLNLDNAYDGQDIQVILGIRDARKDVNCGSSAQSPCTYSLLSVCDDGSFRVQGLAIYNNGVAYTPTTEQNCPFTMEAS